MGDWKASLARITEQYWQSTGKALLLAQVPTRLKAQGIELSRELGGRRLREAISFDGADVVRLVQNPKALLVWGLIPRDAECDRPLAELFEASPKTEPATRFNRAIWAAFLKPLDENKRRFVLVDQGFNFDDIGAEDMPPPQGIEVPRSLIASRDRTDDERAVQAPASIAEWAMKNKIDVADLGPRPRDKLARKAKLLDLTGLSDEDLKRIHIPLDLWLKIQLR